MAHCKPEEIEDLRAILEEILTWDGIQERGFGKFYLKSKSFLHFHSKDGRRWADVRDGIGWGKEVELPFKATAIAKKKFLSEVEKRYKNSK
jgi:hypothetical protein